MKKIMNSIEIAFLLLIAIPSCLYSFEIKAKDFQTDRDPYSIINKLTTIQDNKQELTVSVFETGGGDPAMNGNILIINICEWDYADGNCYTWETGINIYEVVSIRIENNECFVECTEHIIGGDDNIETISMQYVIKLSFNENGHLGNLVNIEREHI